MSCRLWLLLLLTFACAVCQFPDANNLNGIIADCQLQNQLFAEIEEKYKAEGDTGERPNLAGRQTEEFQFTVYEKEKLQRPFECITYQTNEIPKVELEANAMYQALVLKCNANQTVQYCDSFSPYRTMDGTCNNLLNPRWGSTFWCARNLMPSRYVGASGFRRSVTGERLPDPRFLSLKIHEDKYQPSYYVTQLLVFFGQSVAHDLVDTPLTFIGNLSIDCCNNPGKDQHPQCAPILLRKDDPFYSKFNVTCFNFVRSAMCTSCTVGKRRPINQATSFLDLSVTYGSTQSIASKLRLYDGTGKLRTQPKNVGDLLPPIFNGDFCGEKEKEEYCFASGDHRVNQHTVLTSIETILMREHNRIAEKLRSLNPHWEGEILYQEARKILIAVYQKIVYNDYLPNLIGHNLMSKYGLYVQNQGNTVYDPSVDPTTLTEFSTAAYRLHSLLNGVVTNFQVELGKRLFRNESLDVTPLYHGTMDSLIKGTTLSPSKEYSNHVVNDLTRYLYRRPKGSYGFDIVSVHIQRGRDLGLPSYTDAKYYLSGGEIDIKYFDDLLQYMKPENVELLKEMYSDVKDIDLWVGMNSERIPEGMLIGSTAAEITARQFHSLKYGDRFHFEHYGQFRDDQLQSIRATSASKILCDNLKIESIQENPFLFPSTNNSVRLCGEIAGLNLELWREYATVYGMT